MRWLVGAVLSIAMVGAAAASCAPATCRSTADCPTHVACVFAIGGCTGVGRCIGIDGDTTCRAPLVPLCACGGGTTVEYCDDPRGYTRAPAISNQPCFPTPPPAPKDPCTSDDDCYGASCLFQVDAGCSAVGHCMTSAIPCPAAPFACACDGTTILVNGCDPKLAGKPIRSLGLCDDAGGGALDASADARD